MQGQNLALSPEVWTVVLDYLDNMEAMSLWMTGSSLVRLRLGAQGGWKVLKIGGKRGAPWFRIWPRLLINNLHALSVLRIAPPHVDALLPMLKPMLEDIQQLPKSLTSLRFDFVDPVTDAWLVHLPPQLTRLSLPYNRAISGPGLRNLNLNIEILDLQSNTRICDASWLPRGLMRYICNDEAIRPSATLGQDLPPYLLELEIKTKKKGLQKWKVSDLACLASHTALTSLEVMSIGTIDGPLAELALPRTLTSLKLTGNPKLSDTCFASFPPGLRILKLSFKEEVYLAWSNESLGLLPRTLTQLEVMPVSPKLEYRFAQFKYISTLSPECISFLPPDLKVLWLRLVSSPNFVFSPAIAVAHPLGRSRTRQQVELQEQMDLYAPLLPCGLTDLYLPLVHGRITVWPRNRHLPRTITNLPHMKIVLDLRNGPDSAGIKTSVIPAFDSLPDPGAKEDLIRMPNLRTLANLRLNDLTHPMTSVEIRSGAEVDPFWFKGCSGSRLRRVAWNFNNIPIKFRSPGLPSRSLHSGSPARFYAFELLEALPRTLTALNLQLYDIVDEDILALPDSLTELTITNGQHLTDECLPALPRDLVRFTLCISHSIRGNIYPWPRKLTFLSLDYVNAQSVPPREKHGIFFQPRLPPSLTQLRLGGASLSDCVFSHGVPPLLTSLVFSTGSQRFTPEIFKSLPETLVKYAHPELDFFDEDVQFLPRSLRSFSGSAQSLTEASSSHWPPLLRKLSIRGDLFTNTAIKNLPRTLTSLFLPNAILCDFTTVRGCLGPAIQNWSISSFVGVNLH